MRSVVSLWVAGILLAGCTLSMGSYKLAASQPVAPARVEKAVFTQIPFPPGEWVELGEYRFQNGATDLVSSGTTVSIGKVYGQIRDGKLVGTMEVDTNATRSDRRFGMGPPCTEPVDPHFKNYASDIEPGLMDWSCVAADVRFYHRPGKTTPEYYDKIFAAAQQYGGLSTHRAVRITVAAGSDRDALVISFIHFPDRDGLSLDQGWEPGQEGPEQHAYVAQQLQAGQDFRPIVKKAVRNQL